MDLSASVISAMHTAAMAALAAQIDAAGPGAKLVLYSTARPSPNGAPGGAPMVQVILGYSCGTAAAGVLTLADTDFAQITAGGTAVWARLLTATDIWVADLSVGTSAMHSADPLTAEVILAATTMYTGAFLALVGAQIVGN